MENKKLNISELLKGGGVKKVIIICGVVGMLLILLSTFTDLDGQKNEISNYSVKEYKTAMQEELQQILFKIEGVGHVEVLLTIENSVEGVYLENNSTKTKEIEPVIRGVVVGITIIAFASSSKTGARNTVDATSPTCANGMLNNSVMIRELSPPIRKSFPISSIVKFREKFVSKRNTISGTTAQSPPTTMKAIGEPEIAVKASEIAVQISIKKNTFI